MDARNKLAIGVVFLVLAAAVYLVYFTYFNEAREGKEAEATMGDENSVFATGTSGAEEGELDTTVSVGATPKSQALTTASGATPPEEESELPATASRIAEGEPALNWLPVAVVLALLAVFVAYTLIQRRTPMGMERRGALENEVELYKTLSSDTRLGILKELNEGERTPTDLSTRLGKSKATISEHLDRLVDVQLVEKEEKEGRKWVFYKLTFKGKEAVKKEKGFGG
ncbi:MAG: winged helix-turn-helix domain-containing protein [Candidatus Micrarchaeota archaeon]